MKAKNIVGIQILFLAAAVVAGAILKTDLASGPRVLHRSLGLVAALAGVVGLAMLVKQKADLNQKIFASIALALSLKAGLAGRMLKTTDNYQFEFNMMRLSGMLALAAAITVFVLIKRTKKRSKVSAD